MIPTVTPHGGEPAAHPQPAHCGHARHVGTCPACQRAAQRRSKTQLAAAVAARETWANRALPARGPLTDAGIQAASPGPAPLDELASASFSMSVPLQSAA